MNEELNSPAENISRELSSPLILFPGLQSGEIYRKLVLASPDVITITDLKGTILYVSPVTLKIFGGDERDILGTRIFDWVAEVHKEKTLVNFRTLLDGLDPEDSQYVLKRVDGSEFYSEIHSSLLTDKDDKTVGITFTIRDITKRKKEQKELEQNENRYKLLFESAHDSIFLMNGPIVFDCNSKALDTFGCLKEEIVGTSPWDFSPPLQPDGSDSIQKAKEKIKAALNGNPQQFEWKQRKLNGTLFDSEVSLNTITIGDNAYLQALVRNISKRKKADDQLRKFSECMLSFSSDPSYNINLLTTLCGEIMGAVCSLYTRKRRDLMHSSGTWNIPDEFKTASYSKGYLCFDTFSNDNQDIYLVRDLQKTSYCQTDPIVSLNRIMTYAGKMVHAGSGPIGVLSAFFHNDYIPDAADRYLMFLIASVIGVEEERKSSQDKMVRYTEELRELNNTKDKFFSIIAHDLKGPFNAIMGFSDILTTEWDNYSEEERQNFIRNIYSSARNTYRLLENLLEWASTQTGIIHFQPARIDLSLLANDVVIFLREQAEKKQIKVYTAVNFNTSVMADENMVRTVFRNVVSNAIKFTPEGGQVKILAHKIAATTDQPSMIEVCVEDTGVGIEPDLLTKLFRIDEKIGASGTAQEKGTGLGLILCRELIEKNHGMIYVESEPGKGSRFCFTLPMAE
ncbi:MAG: PAS domain-containing sensor histidine kinase [Bacteroidales bacterium]|nr:PAS domain-containing sensor histidine kinase [Bacteroidales bacterium]